MVLPVLMVAAMSNRIIELQQRCPFGRGNIDMVFAVPREPPQMGAHLPFEIWFYSNDGAGPFLVVNPSLEIKVHTRHGPSSRSSDVLRLPVCPGGLGSTGGLATQKAVIWRPYVQLSTESILALDRMRDLDHGLRVEFEMDAAAVSFVPLCEDSTWPAASHADSLIWRQGFNITPDIWREFQTAWGWPRSRVFELNPASFSSLDEFENAVAALKTAEKQLFLGHWAEAIAKARLVVEAVLRHLGLKERNATHWQTMESAGLPSEMSTLIKAFNSVTSLEHHPTGNSDAWRRADARFLVQLAASLAEYAATLPPQGRAP